MRSASRIIFAFFVTVHAVGATGAEVRREVRNPHYGAALFEFYRDHYFSALSRVMVDHQFKRLSPHQDEAELMRGGILLSYGAHLEAGRIFERLIAQGAAPPVRDRAWFYIAKIRYQRGYMEQAEEAIARVEGVLPGELEEERRLLHANLLMQRGRYKEAVEMLRRLPPRSDWAAYGRFNLGVALIRAGEKQEGERLLDELGRSKARNEELAALRDKSNVALAYAFLQEDQPLLAKAALERVRLQGLMSNKALLGFGWTYQALDEYERALVPWTELAERNVVDAAVQESLLAVPYAYGKLGAYRQALEGYEAALEAYTRESRRIEEAIAAIRAGRLVANILRANPADEVGWFWRMDDPPDLPEARYLVQLMASHDFQEALKNYRDLRFMDRHLEEWAGQIALYNDMLDNRRKAFTARLPAVLARERNLGIAQLRATRDAYQERIARIEADGDVGAFASAREQELRDRLERVRKALATTKDPEAAERYRLLNGLLAWDMTADYSERLWRAKRDLQEIDRKLAEAEARRDALARAEAETPREFDAFGNRIAQLRRAISERRAALAALAVEQEHHIAGLAVEELARQRERIASYVLQARFAVAQIYDEAVRAKEQTP